MIKPNRLCDIDPEKFTIYGYCADCDHSAIVPRVDESMTIPALKANLKCGACGSHDTSTRIYYTGAGEFQWG
jgi:hypothetical protein